MEIAWDDLAASWDTEPSVVEYSKMALSLVQKLALPSLSGPIRKIVDVGCGTGSLTRLMVDMADEIVAIDPSGPMIAKVEAAGLAKVKARHGVVDGAFAREYESSVDLVVASSVCAFVPDYLGLVSNIATMLREGGVFLQLDWQDEKATLDEHGGGFSAEVLHMAVESVPTLEAVVIGKVADFRMIQSPEKPDEPAEPMPVVGLVARRCAKTDPSRNSTTS